MMNKRTVSIIGIAWAIVQLSLPAFASTPDGPRVSPADSPLYFNNADKNHDGSIGRSEVPTELHDLRAHFDLYDTDHDHRLSEAEYVSYLRTLGTAACRNDIHINQKCAVSPYSADPERIGNGGSPAVSPPKTPVGH